ncbi:MAG: hypothetical protein V1725_05205 [archaeon]
MFDIVPSRLFLKQIDKLSADARHVLNQKISLLRKNPFRFKKLHGYRFLFRIRFSDNHTSKRLIYFVQKNAVKLVCILDRDKDYVNLAEQLERSFP